MPSSEPNSFCIANVIQRVGKLALEAAVNEMDKGLADGAARMAQLTDMIMDQIRKLAELHEEGILTEEEFAAKKADLLNRL